MNLKLEELRKLLLEPVPGQTRANNTVYRRSGGPYGGPPWPSERAAEEPKANEPQAEAASDVTEEAPATPESVMSAVLEYVKQTAASAPLRETMEQNSQYQLAQAVARVFEQTKNFQNHFADLTRMFEPVESVSMAALGSIEPLRSFEQQLAQFARSFEPMRAFQSQLAQLAQTFEPMKGLQEQLSQVSEAFQVHLGRLAKSLEPAKEFQLELLRLARAFDSVADLQGQFARLGETFRRDSNSISGGSAIRAIATGVSATGNGMQH
jgi:hypothetical protein